MASTANRFPLRAIRQGCTVGLVATLMALPATIALGQTLDSKDFDQNRDETNVDDRNVESATNVAVSEDTIRFWNARAKRGPVRAGEAAAALTRLKQGGRASAVIESIDIATLSENQLRSVAEFISPVIRLKMLADPQTSEAARQRIKRLTQRIESVDQNPQQLSAAIDAIIKNRSSATRATAIRRLANGGSQAVAAIVNHVTSSPAPETGNRAAGNTETDNTEAGNRASGNRAAGNRASGNTVADDTLVRIAMQIDPAADRAFRQLAIYGIPEVRARANVWLSRLESSESETSMMAVTDAGWTPTASMPATGIDAVNTSFLAVRDNVQRRDVDRSLTTAWVIDNDRKKIAPVRTTSLIADYRRVVDAASVRYSMFVGAGFNGVSAAAAARDFLAADLAYRVIMDYDWGDQAAFESVVASHSILQSPTATSALGITLDEAIDRDDHPAMLGLVRLIRDRVVGQVPPAGTPPELTGALVRATRSDLTWVRYEAALILKNHFDSLPYAGQSFVAKTLAEMRSLGDRPTIVLVETRLEIALLMEKFLRSSGFEVERFSSVAETIRFLDRGGDIRMILSKRQLADRLPIELVDLVRRTTTMRHVPIVFFNEPAIDDEFGFYSASETDTNPVMPVIDNRFDGLTTQIDFPRTMAALRPTEQTIKRRQRIPPLGAADRRFFADSAESP